MLLFPVPNFTRKHVVRLPHFPLGRMHRSTTKTRAAQTQIQIIRSDDAAALRDVPLVLSEEGIL